MLAQVTYPSSPSRDIYKAVYGEGYDDTVVIVDNITYNLSSLVEQLADAKTVFLDTEATSVDAVNATPLLLQLLWDEKTYVVVLSALVREDMRPLFQALSTKLIVGHNLNYDYRLLRSHYDEVRFSTVYDTQLAEQLLTGGEEDDKKHWLARVALKSLAKKYVHFELDKGERETFQNVVASHRWRPSREQVEYSADDVFILRPIMEAQLERLRDEGLWRAALLRFGAVIPLADMELRGIRVDAAAWREYLATLAIERTEVETQLRTLLTLNEHHWRQQQYEVAKREKAEWEQDRDTVEALARGIWERRSADPQFAPEPWGKYKVEFMRQWREDHPNPGVPHLDTSPIDLSSNQQMKRAYSFLGLEMESLDAKHRERLLERMDLTDEQRSTVERHARYQQLSTINSRYGENLLAMLDANSRLHGHFNIGLTETGRMSSDNPNFQNFPKDERIRRAFIADEGMVMLTADYSGQELAIAAALSGDERMKADINAGKDLYKELAVRVWGVRLEDVTKEQRQMAKAAVLGIIYGQGFRGLVNRYGMEEELAKALIANLKKVYSRLSRWGDHQMELARDRGYVTTVSGARRRFRDIEEMGWKLSTESRNAPIQGSAADVVYRLVWRLKQVEHTGLVAVNIIHDEAVCLAPAENPAYFVTLLEGEMMQAFYDLFPFDKYGVRVGVETHVAGHWSKEKSTISALSSETTKR